MAITIEQLAAKFEPALSKAFLSAMAKLKNQTSYKTLTKILREQGAQGLIDSINNIENVLSAELKNSLDDAIQTGGRQAIQFIPKAGIIVDTFAFNPFDYHASDFVRRYEYNLINQISRTTVEGVRQGVMRSVMNGDNPIVTARDFRSSLGLTARQEQAVYNYRSYLENNDKRALERLLRDKRFDPTIQRAIATNQRLKKAQIDKMVIRYKERYIKYRSEVIARTEALRAVSIGQDLAIKQMMADKVLDEDNIRQFWVFTKDGKTRSAHRAIPGMNEGGIPLGAKFKTPLGELAHPRDPNGTAANTTQCRCRRVFRYVEQILKMAA